MYGNLSEWPQNGKISFENVELRYSSELPAVLHNVTFTVQAGEKVGIVGRTGAGKSSIMLGLFRLVEISEGRITIDNINIATIDLEVLRNKLAIIPQDPVLFSGTVRSNLDPACQHTDDELWSALEKAHLKAYIIQLSKKLESEVLPHGENFSVGQRQLVCLARAILRKARILIMDEATANIDFHTDALIQESVRKEFASSTVLTIAHRLNTIMDYEKVLVLDHGRVIEFGKPAELLEAMEGDSSSNRGLFLQMVEETGETNANLLKDIARRQVE